MEDLSIAYTPGVAAVCLDIANNKESEYTNTTKKKLVAVVTDGSAVLGLGNIGPEAAIVTACQSGMGGTGDVAIRSASNSMHLMPFAQVATRLGGAITVISMTSLLRFLF